MLATEDIQEGEELALIPRHAVLSAHNSNIVAAMETDKEFKKCMRDKSDWIPLLLALLFEWPKKVDFVVHFTFIAPLKLYMWNTRDTTKTIYVCGILGIPVL